MKENFIKYLTNEIEAKKSFMAQNELSDADREVMDAAIKNLEAIKEEMEAAEETNPEALEELKKAVEELQEKLQVVSEKIIDSNKEIPEEMVQNFLQTNEAMHAFANAIRQSGSGAQFRENWNKVLVENGIEFAENAEVAYLPAAVKDMITDKWERDASWLRDLRHTGAKRFYVRPNTSSQDAEGSRAKGWTKGKTKVSEELTFAAKLIEADFIYKLIEIDAKTEWNDDDNSLVRYVVDELGDQILYEIKRAILIGDGRDNDSDYKINSFESIDRQATDNYVTVVTGNASNFLIDEMVKTVNSIKNPNAKPVFAFMSKTALTSLRRFQSSENATPMYLPIEQIAEQLDVAKIVETELMSGNNAIFMLPDEYVLVGDPLAPAYMKDHQIYKNINVYREELCVGGGVRGLASASILKFA
jgi:hypothetical protein